MKTDDRVRFVKAGARPRVPAFSLVVAFLASASVFFAARPTAPFRPAAAFAGPPTEDPFPELKDKKKPKHAPTPLESAAARAAATLRSGNGVALNADAVEFALWLYGEEGRAADRDRATKLARDLANQGWEHGSVAALFRVAQASGPTLHEAEDALQKQRDALAAVTTLATQPYASLVLDLMARAAATADPAAIGDALLTTGTLWQLRTGKAGASLQVLAADGKPETLAAYETALRVGLEAASLSGSPSFREECRMLAHELLRRFWNEGRERFQDTKTPGDQGTAGASKDVKAEGTAPGSGASNALRENARAALAVWETGLVCGDALLRGRGQRALEGALRESLKDPQAMAAAGLAAGRMASHPVEMALVGNPADPVLIELRQAAYCVFEPSRVILNLDPAVDAARFAETLYPPDLAPALFVCVETLCSPPIKAADGLAAHVKEIRKLAAEAGN